MTIPPLSSLNPLIGGTFAIALLMCGLGCALMLQLHHSEPPLDGLEFIFVVIVLGTALALWLGLILASIGRFSLIALSSVLIVIGFSSGLIARQAGVRFTRRLSRPSRLDAAFLGVLAISSVFYLRPHEFIFGAADAGVYVNMGATISRTGSLLVHDETVARLDPIAYADVFREQPQDLLTRYYQFPGFYASDSQRGEIIPQFFAVQAVAIAIFTSIGGVQLGLYATPVFGLLGIAAIYFFTRRLLDTGPTAWRSAGRRAAILAAILLAANPTQVWFARYPTAEVLTQACLFFGLYALSGLLAQHSFGQKATTEIPDSTDVGGDDERRRTNEIGWGALAGFWLGLIFLVRIDMILVAVVLIAALVVWITLRRWRRGLTAFVIALGVMSAHTIIHAVVLAWPYVWNSYSGVFRSLLGQRASIWIASGLIGLVAAIVGLRWLSRLAVERRSQFERWLRMALIVSVIVASGYAYFIRPVVEAPQTATNWYDAQGIIITNHENLVRIGWYITPLGLALAVVGLCMMLWRERSSGVNIFVTIGLLSTVVYVINILNNPHQIYASRRYVPVVMPALTIWGAYSLTVLSRARRRLVIALGVMAAIAWLGGMIYQARLIGVQVDDAGAVKALSELNDQLAPGAIVLMNDQSVVGFGDAVGTPLRYLFDHPVFVLRTKAAWSSEWLKTAVRDWQHSGRPVYVLSAAATDLASIAPLPIEPRAPFTFETTVLEPSYTQFPDRLLPIKYDFRIDQLKSIK